MKTNQIIGTSEKTWQKEYSQGRFMKTPLFWGVVAGTILLAVYFGVLTAFNSFNHALNQFQEMWYWILLLVVGFSFQVGLYAYIRKALKLRAHSGEATSSVAAAGGISTTSMVACCAHHVTDVIPILGLSAAAVFLNQFQTLFILVGVLSNLVGINLMLKIVQEHKLYHKQSKVLSTLMKYDMKKSLYGVVIFSIIIFVIALLNTI